MGIIQYAICHVRKGPMEDSHVTTSSRPSQPICHAPIPTGEQDELFRRVRHERKDGAIVWYGLFSVSFSVPSNRRERMDRP